MTPTTTSRESATPFADRVTESVRKLFEPKQSPQDEVLAELRLIRQAIERTQSDTEAARLVALRQKPLLTLDETAEVLGISRSSVENLITVKAGTGKPRLKTVREPGTRIVRVTQADWTAYVERLRAESR
jgi:hypothetical protein